MSHVALGIPNQQWDNLKPHFGGFFGTAWNIYRKAGTHFAPLKVPEDCSSGAVTAMETYQWSRSRKNYLKVAAVETALNIMNNKNLTG